MTQSAYRKTLTTARRDLDRLYRQREELERKIARLRQTIISLGALTKEGKEREIQKKYVDQKEKLTDAVLSVIAASDVPLHPVDIQKRLEGLGYDIGSTNPTASVWSVLKRLESRPAFKPGKTAIRMYERPNEKTGRLRGIGYWWGDQPPPKPWVPCKWWETRKEETKAKKAKERAEKE